MPRASRTARFLGICGFLLLGLCLIVILSGDYHWPGRTDGEFGAAASDADSTQIVVAVVPDVGMPLTSSLTADVTHCIRRRADALGLNRARISQRGRGRILIVLPPVSDLDRVVTTLTQQQLLEIVDPRGITLASGTIVTTTYAPPGSPAGPSGTPATTNAIYETIVTSADLLKSEIVTNPSTHQSELVLLFTKAAGARLALFTQTHQGQPLAIVIAKRVVVSPIIQGTISTTAAIAGTSPRETRVLNDLLQAANLPAGVVILSERGLEAPTPTPPPAATPVPTVVPTPTPILADAG